MNTFPSLDDEKFVQPQCNESTKQIKGSQIWTVSHEIVIVEAVLPLLVSFLDDKYVSSWCFSETYQLQYFLELHLQAEVYVGLLKPAKKSPLDIWDKERSLRS